MAPAPERRASVEAEIVRLARRLERDASVQRVILFGSWAWGEPRKWSDIDLLVVQETAVPFRERHAILRRLVETREPLDLIVLAPEELRRRLEIGDPFLRDVCERGRELHAA